MTDDMRPVTQQVASHACKVIAGTSENKSKLALFCQRLGRVEEAVLQLTIRHGWHGAVMAQQCWRMLQLFFQHGGIIGNQRQAAPARCLTMVMDSSQLMHGSCRVSGSQLTQAINRLLQCRQVVGSEQEQAAAQRQGRFGDRLADLRSLPQR